MNKWSPERAEAIRQFIDEYVTGNRKSSTVRDITAGTGLSKTSVQRCLKAHGEIKYNGRRSICTNLSCNMFEITPAIRYDSTVSCGLPSESNVENAEIITLSITLVGDGKLFILTAKGDSMTMVTSLSCEGRTLAETEIMQLCLSTKAKLCSKPSLIFPSRKHICFK